MKIDSSRIDPEPEVEDSTSFNNESLQQSPMLPQPNSYSSVPSAFKIQLHRMDIETDKGPEQQKR